MLVIACIKQVPDTTQVQIDPVTNTLIREGVPFIVNPYDTEQLAEAIRVALEMDPEERRARMRRMRRVVKDHNIYRWAANLITELSEVRIEQRHRLLPR